MLTFFRRIRQGFLMKGQLPKYLLYAVGEVLLVVIGILLALQINTWNEAHQNRKLEKEYLERMLNDLDLDLLDLSTALERACVNIVLAEDALIKLGADTSILARQKAYQWAHKEVSIKNGKIFYKGTVRDKGTFRFDSFGCQLTQLTKDRGFDLTQTTINDLMATGKIEVIRDNKLRKAIQSYYGLMHAQIGNEGAIVRPHVSYLNTLLTDMGIPPWSKLRADEVRLMADEEKRLVPAIYNLFEANSIMIRLYHTSPDSYDNRIHTLKKTINEVLETL